MPKATTEKVLEEVVIFLSILNSSTQFLFAVDLIQEQGNKLQCIRNKVNQISLDNELYNGNDLVVDTFLDVWEGLKDKGAKNVRV